MHRAIQGIAFHWLAQVEKSEAINFRQSSYGLKHWVEQHSGLYCCNGAFIAAAIHHGFEFVQDGPNANFNFDEQSLNELAKRPRRSWRPPAPCHAGL